MSLSTALKELTVNGDWVGPVADLANVLNYDPQALSSSLSLYRDDLASIGIVIERAGSTLTIGTRSAWSREPHFPEFNFGLPRPDRYSQAKHLADCGLSLIPCEWGGKRPTIPSWTEFQRQPATASQLAKWTQQETNLAIVCGEVSRVVAVDLDSPAALEWAEANLPVTDVKTQTGEKHGFRGQHWFYRHPGKPVGNKARATLPDGSRRELDIRGDGGYVMAPGCLHASGVLYEAWGKWTRESFDWLPMYPALLLTEDTDSTTVPVRTITRRDGDTRAFARARAWISCRKPATSGDLGDSLTFTTACALVRGFLLSDEEALELLRDWNRTCEPPWTDGKLQQKIRSARKSGKEPLGYLLGQELSRDSDTEWAASNSSSQVKRQAALTSKDETEAMVGEVIDPTDLLEVPDTLRNDQGNAFAYVSAHQNCLRFCHDQKEWYYWKKPVWRKDTTQAHKFLYLNFCQDQLESNENIDERKRWLGALNAGKVNAALQLAQVFIQVAANTVDFDRHTWDLNCENGTLDLKSGQLKPHNRQEMHTKLTRVNYSPDATCPMWTRFLLEIMGGDQELVDYLQRVVGYTLTGDTKEEVFFFLYGVGANGKSTFLEVLKELLGTYGRAAEFETFTRKEHEGGSGPRPDVIALIGARLVMASETGSDSQLDTGLLKKMTGRDTMAARDLYRGLVEFVPQWKIFLVANHKPRIRDSSIGTWRRLHLIPFTVTIPEERRDQQLRAKLLAELPGILNWALAGCQEWQRAGLRPPRKISDAGKDYQDEMDPIGRFLADCCVTGHHNYYTVPAKRLYEEYQAWCSECGEKEWSQTAFGRALSGKSYERRKLTANRIFHWIGIGLASEIEEPGNKIQEEMF